MDTGLEWIGEGVFRVGDLLFKDGGPHGLKPPPKKSSFESRGRPLQGDDRQVRVSVLAHARMENRWQREIQA